MATNEAKNNNITGGGPRKKDKEQASKLASEIQSFSKFFRNVEQNSSRSTKTRRFRERIRQWRTMNQNQPKEHAIMNTVQRKRQTKGTNVEIESKLNSVYNRIV